MTTALTLYRPALYAQSIDGSGPILLGGRCECGYVFFPMQRFGCERCGRHGDAIEPVALRGSGVLLASATVHLHVDKRRTAPFVVGTIALDDGPVIRTLLTYPAKFANLPVRVVGEFVPIRLDDTGEKLDLRFKPENTQP